MPAADACLPSKANKNNDLGSDLVVQWDELADSSVAAGLRAQHGERKARLVGASAYDEILVRYPALRLAYRPIDALIVNVYTHASRPTDRNPPEQAA
jgi:hypothetical protein